MSEPHSEEWLILAAVMKHVNVSRRTIYNYVKRGLIKPKEKHGVKLYSVTKVKEALGEC